MYRLGLTWDQIFPNRVRNFYYGSEWFYLHSGSALTSDISSGNSNSSVSDQSILSLLLPEVLQDEREDPEDSQEVVPEMEH